MAFCFNFAQKTQCAILILEFLDYFSQIDYLYLQAKKRSIRGKCLDFYLKQKFFL